MQEDERPALRQQRPQLAVHRVVEVEAAAAAADGDAGHPSSSRQRRASCAARATRGAPSPARPAGPGRPRRRPPARRCPSAPRPARTGRRRTVEQNRNGGRDTACRSSPRRPSPTGARPRRTGSVPGERGPGADAADPRVEPDDPVRDAVEVREPAVGEPGQQRQWHRVRVHVKRAPAPGRRPSRAVGCLDRHPCTAFRSSRPLSPTSATPGHRLSLVGRTRDAARAPCQAASATGGSWCAPGRRGRAKGTPDVIRTERRNRSGAARRLPRPRGHDPKEECSGMTTPDVSAELEAATQRVRELGEQVAEQARKNGLAWLEGYETVLKNMLDLEDGRQGHRSRVGHHAGQHARQLRPLDVRGRPRRPAPAAQGRRPGVGLPPDQRRPRCIAPGPYHGGGGAASAYLWAG